MPPNAGYRARVERLLNRQGRADDIPRLFLFARDRCNGKEAVQEVGDFVAHHHERTKGISTRTVRDFFIIARFNWERLKGNIHDSHMPINIDTIIDIMLKRLDGTHLTRTTGYTVSQAKRMIPCLKEKLEIRDGQRVLAARASSDERRLLNYLINTINAKPAFDDTRLFNDFASTLLTNGVLKFKEVEAFKATMPLVTMTAVAEMQGCAIEIAPGDYAQCSIGDPVNGEELVNINAQAAMEPGINLSFPLYVTSLRVAEFVGQSVTEDNYKTVQIEISNAGLLEALA